jgi:uncharacterized protein YgiM (DUF1202 family)
MPGFRAKYVRTAVFAQLFIFAAVLLAETLVVQVKSAFIRKEPVFYSAVVAEVTTGEEVEEISSKNGWIMVRTSGGQEGWLHSSAVRRQKFSLLALNQPVKTQADADEVALAGKGFNKQVEDTYRSEHPGIDYTWVEKMLNIRVSPAQLKAFLEQGKLGEFGGPR